jgi:hypothetical protein
MRKKLTVDLNRLVGFNEANRKKIYDAITLIELVVNSLSFKREVLKLRFPGKDSGRNAAFYARFMSGASDHGGEDFDIDIDLTYYYSRWSRVVGYGLPGTIRTWINGKFLSWMKIHELAGHLVHEYVHKLGYQDDHGQNSVPYIVGYLVEELASKPDQLDHFQDDSIT